MSTELQVRAGERIIRRIFSLAPPDAALSTATVAQLRQATEELIQAYQAEGKLDESPAALAMNRTVDLQHELAQARVQGQRVLVTGGAGCVGTRLIPLLVSLGAAEIAIVDIASVEPSVQVKPSADQASPAPHATPPRRSRHQVDIRDVQALNAVFQAVRPEVVFHLASIREPGRAEAVVREAIETNVFGTRNVIEACLRHGVQDAVYSSTGKCFAYISDHVYTGSKKLAEAQWVAAARGSASTRFRCTRFTHVMENGVIAQDIDDGIASGVVGLHGPDRHFNIQNLRQATHLLVNAVALSEQTVPDGFWSAVDLGWPVNSLELALYRIRASGKPVAVRFLGVPKGYDETFFRGQFCWSADTEYHPLINAIEASSRFEDATGTMVGARVPTFDAAALAMELAGLETALANHTLDVLAIKQALVEAVAGLARAVFAEADLQRLVDILWSGAAPAWAGVEASEAMRFKCVIGLLTDAIIARLERTSATLKVDVRYKLLEVSQTLSAIGMDGEAAFLRNRCVWSADVALATTAEVAGAGGAPVGNSSIQLQAGADAPLPRPAAPLTQSLAV